MITATQRRHGTNGTSAPPAAIRVAIYTRKSDPKGLEAEFTSLEAQRQAAEAYVASQQGAGWVALEERYDDGGFTGANTDRPAFQRLLRDIEAGRIDTLAVYKIDRLSRSLLDFMKVMDFFQKHGVTFVSVTQSFDTNTSMGRLTLNLLATFAQFEREVISERTRDKMGASRRKGLWVGGTVPFGYAIRDQQLVPKDDEAAIVKLAFEKYVSLGSLLSVVEDLNREGLRNRNGKPFNKHALRYLLGNPVYAGQIRYHDEVLEGSHPPLIERAMWDAVQRQINENGGSERRICCRSGALLSGLVRCACGASMCVQSARKGNRKYHYYVCQTVQKQGAAACAGSRVATRDLEAFVVEKIRDIGKDPKLVAETIQAAKHDLLARRPEIEKDLHRLEKDRERHDKERRNLVDAVGKGKASPAILQRLGELDLAVRGNEVQVAKLKDELEAMKSQVIDERDLRAALASFTPVWDQLFPAERRRVMQLLVQSVTFDAKAGEVAITFRPTGVRSLAGGGQKEAP